MFFMNNLFCVSILMARVFFLSDYLLWCRNKIHFQITADTVTHKIIFFF